MQWLVLKDKRCGNFNSTLPSLKNQFQILSVFADKDENPHLPGSDWDLNFNEVNGITKVSISIYNESLERMEKMIEMGFKEGFTMTLNELTDVLISYQNKK